MSLMGMKRFVEKFGVAVVVLMALPLLVGIVYSGIGRNISNSGPSPEANSEKPVARIGERSIGRGVLDNALAAAGRGGQMPPPTPELVDMFRLMTLDQIKSQETVVVAAQKEGIPLGDDQIKAAAEEDWQKTGRAGVVSQLRLDPKATDDDINAALRKINPDLNIDIIKAQNADPDRLRVSLAYRKLQEKFSAGITADEALVRRSYNDVRIRHILIKFGEGALPEAQAKEKAEKVLAEVLKDPSKMAQLAKENSDDPGSKDKGGLYEWQSGQTYVPEFTAGALTAGLNKVNPSLVRTTYGFHIVRLEGERPGKGFPKDFDKEKKRYLDQYVERIASGRASEAIKAAEASVKIEILDSGLKAAKLVREAEGPQRNAKLAEAIAELDKVSSAEDPLGAVPLRKAAIYETLGKDKEAVGAYEAALEGRNLPETRFKLAAVLQRLKQPDQVKVQIDALRRLPLTSPDQWKQLADLYRFVGDRAGEMSALDKNQQLTKRQQDLEKAQAQRNAAPPPAAAGPKPNPGK